MAERVIIVHTLAQAMGACETAAALQTPLTLQSAPDAIFYAGSLYLLQLFAQAQAAFPGVKITCILDCSDAGAEAISAMQIGHKHLRSSAAPEIKVKLADIAEQMGVMLHDNPYEALDLLTAPDTKDACKKWLERDA